MWLICIATRSWLGLIWNIHVVVMFTHILHFVLVEINKHFIAHVYFWNFTSLSDPLKWAVHSRYTLLQATKASHRLELPLWFRQRHECVAIWKPVLKEFEITRLLIKVASNYQAALLPKRKWVQWKGVPGFHNNKNCNLTSIHSNTFIHNTNTSLI